jgi:hypothetical protein
MARKVYSRRRAGRVDAGAAWIYYSDMMAALLLVFVLVLTYSVYQYFEMLESKTTELDTQQSELLDQAKPAGQRADLHRGAEGLLKSRSDPYRPGGTIAAARPPCRRRRTRWKR